MSGAGGKKDGRRRDARRSDAGRRDELPRRLADVLSPALDRLAGGDDARAYSAWARAVGDPVTGGTRPKAFRRGQLTIECASSVWANELTYLGPQILRRMDEVAPGHPVKRFRFVVGRLTTPREAVEGIPGDEQTPLPAGRADAAADGPATGPSGQGSGTSAAKKKRRDQQPAPDAHEAARTQAEGVQDGRLRAAIEAALRRSSEEPPEAPGRGTPSG